MPKTYYEQGRLNKAVAAFQEAIKIKPDYAAAHHNLGATYRKQCLSSTPKLWDTSSID